MIISNGNAQVERGKNAMHTARSIEVIIQSTVMKMACAISHFGTKVVRNGLWMDGQSGGLSISSNLTSGHEPFFRPCLKKGRL